MASNRFACVHSQLLPENLPIALHNASRLKWCTHGKRKHISAWIPTEGGCTFPNCEDAQSQTIKGRWCQKINVQRETNTNSPYSYREASDCDQDVDMCKPRWKLKPYFCLSFSAKSFWLDKSVEFQDFVFRCFVLSPPEMIGFNTTRPRVLFTTTRHDRFRCDLSTCTFFPISTTA